MVKTTSLNSGFALTKEEDRRRVLDAVRRELPDEVYMHAAPSLPTPDFPPKAEASLVKLYRAIYDLQQSRGRVAHIEIEASDVRWRERDFLDMTGYEARFDMCRY